MLGRSSLTRAECQLEGSEVEIQEDAYSELISTKFVVGIDERDVVVVCQADWVSNYSSVRAKSFSAYDGWYSLPGIDLNTQVNFRTLGFREKMLKSGFLRMNNFYDKRR